MAHKYHITIIYMDNTSDILIGDVTAIGPTLFTIYGESGATMQVPIRNVKSLTYYEII